MSSLNKWVSINEIISNYISDTNSQKQLRTTTIIDWIGRAMEYMKVTSLSQSKSIELDVLDFQADLPCDILYVEQVYKSGLGALVGSLATGQETYNNQNISRSAPKEINSYSVNYPKLNLYFEKGKITLYYAAVVLDEDGFPMIPDDELFKQACIFYIESKLKFAEYHANKISFDQWKVLDLEFKRVADRFRARMAMLSPDQARSVGNLWQRIIPDIVSQTKLYSGDSNFRYEYNSFNGGVL